LDDCAAKADTLIRTDSRCYAHRTGSRKRRQALEITATLMMMFSGQCMPKLNFGQADQIAPTKQPRRNMADSWRVLRATDRHLCLKINRYRAPDNPEQNQKLKFTASGQFNWLARFITVRVTI